MKMGHGFTILLVCIATLFGNTRTLAQEISEPTAVQAPADRRLPVVLDGERLFRIGQLKSHSAENRVQRITEVLEEVADDPSIPLDSIHVVETDISSDIVAGEHLIMVLTGEDAARTGKSRAELANAYTERIKAALGRSRENRRIPNILKRVAYALMVSAGFAAFLVVTGRVHQRLLKRLDGWVETRAMAAEAHALKILHATRIPRLLTVVLRMTHLLVLLIAVYIYLYICLQIFPKSRSMADRLLEYVVTPLESLANAFVAQIPKLLFLAVLFMIARYLLKGLRAVFEGIESGSVAIAGFYPDWAQPTYKMVRILVLVLFAVIAFPYIPGSNSPVFKGISVFLGVLFSLGSSSAIANMVAGISLVYRRAFKVGDRVRIGEITGRVTNMRLQVTHLQTIKNEEITVPNSLILGSAVTNYSALAGEGGLILHTSVTIGYDTPWRQVHALLELAARGTPGILRDPPPFVLQTGLNDFYITYELNAYTNQPNGMPTIYSHMHRKIQDVFNEYGVQIMSPHYWGDRPVPVTYVPREKWYEPPAAKEEDGEVPDGTSPRQKAP